MNPLIALLVLAFLGVGAVFLANNPDLLVSDNQGPDLPSFTANFSSNTSNVAVNETNVSYDMPMMQPQCENILTNMPNNRLANQVGEGWCSVKEMAFHFLSAFGDPFDIVFGVAIVLCGLVALGLWGQKGSSSMLFYGVIALGFIFVLLLLGVV